MGIYNFITEAELFSVWEADAKDESGFIGYCHLDLFPRGTYSIAENLRRCLLSLSESCFQLSQRPSTPMLLCGPSFPDMTYLAASAISLSLPWWRTLRNLRPRGPRL